jgi:hypothetical protein
MNTPQDVPEPAPDLTALATTLQALECELHQRSTRTSHSRLDALLHPDFLEFGRAGNRFDKPFVLTHLPKQQVEITVHAQDFQARMVAPGVAQLTYRSAHRKPDGTLERHTLRSSLWISEGAQWRLYFHQGTPTAAFTEVPP